jgi:hypothetical protein
MSAFSDEQLSAFLDGAGDPDLTEEIERALKSDEALALRLEALRETDHLLRRSFAEDVARPLALPSVRRTPIRHVSHHYWWAAAAGILVAAVAGWAIGRSGTANAMLAENGTIADASIVQGLDAARSAVPYPLGGGANLSVALSFRAASGERCRQFSLSAPGAASAGVACAHANGWRVIGWVQEPPAQAGGFHPAAGGDDARVEAILNRIGVEHVLNAREEEQAIATAWRSSR